MPSDNIYQPFVSNQYYVYHTTYSGDKLPANYIGSSSVDKVNKNYHGSVASKEYKTIWKSELKEHPELFKTEIISYHDTRSEASYKEYQMQKIFNVVQNPIFINMAYATVNGYFGMDMKGKNKGMANYINKYTNEHKKLSTSSLEVVSGEWIHTSTGRTDYIGSGNPMYGKTGKDNPNFGKTIHSEEHKNNMSIAFSCAGNPMYGIARDDNPNAKLKTKDVENMIIDYKTFNFSLQDLSEKYNIAYVTTKRIIRNNICLDARKVIVDIRRKLYPRRRKI